MENKKLSKEAILSLISEANVFQHYLGKIELGKAQRSVFHKDSNPSLYIHNKGGKIKYLDLAHPEFHGDFIDLVKQMFSISFKEALQKIATDFELPLGDNIPKKDYKQIIREFPAPKPKPPVILKAEFRSFNKQELAYWQIHNVPEQDLIKWGVKAADKIWINDKLIPRKPNELKFIYDYRGKLKIYTPFSEDKKWKWGPNNVPLNTAVYKHIEKQEGKDVILAKSKKDFLVLSQVFPDVVELQNESMACISTELVEFLEGMNIWVGYDADDAGVAASTIVCEHFGWNWINVPKKYLEISKSLNDFAAISLEYGLEAVKDILKQKELL